MSTDFSNNSTTITSSGGLKPSVANTPIDVRTRIETIADVASIPLAYVGMIFYVVDEDKFYKVKSLKDKKIGPLVTKNALVDEYVELMPV